MRRRPPHSLSSGPVLTLWRRLGLACLLIISTGFSPAWAHTEASEQTVKAAYLYNFIKFARWPSNAFNHEQDPIRLCVAGNDDVVRLLQGLLMDKKVDQHEIVALKVTGKVAELRQCHLLYLHPSAPLSEWELLRRVQDYPVLTVGEGSSFLDLGGVMSFVDVDQRIRFEVNLPAARRAGVTLSSRLMKIARSIRQR